MDEGSFYEMGKTPVSEKQEMVKESLQSSWQRTHTHTHTYTHDATGKLRNSSINYKTLKV